MTETLSITFIVNRLKKLDLKYIDEKKNWNNNILINFSNNSF